MYNYEHAPSHWKIENDKADNNYKLLALAGAIVNIVGFALIISLFVK